MRNGQLAFLSPGLSWFVPRRITRAVHGQAFVGEIQKWLQPGWSASTTGRYPWILFVPQVKGFFLFAIYVHGLISACRLVVPRLVGNACSADDCEAQPGACPPGHPKCLKIRGEEPHYYRSALGSNLQRAEISCRCQAYTEANMPVPSAQWCRTSAYISTACVAQHLAPSRPTARLSLEYGPSCLTKEKHVYRKDHRKSRILLWS